MQSKTATTPVNFNVTLPEKAHLEAYCTATGRTQTDVLREAIRNLPEVPAQVA